MRIYAEEIYKKVAIISMQGLAYIQGSEIMCVESIPISLTSSACSPTRLARSDCMSCNPRISLCTLKNTITSDIRRNAAC